MTTTNKMELFNKLEAAKERQQNLERAIGTIRANIMNLNFPGEHRETIDNVLKIVDNAMKSL
jgi:hypothetical protein